MEKLDIKRGKFNDIEGEKLPTKMKEIFGNCETEGDWFVSHFGAMDPIKIRIISKKELEFEINTVTVPEDQIIETMRKRNEFLQFATGFTAKERLKRLKKKAKEGKL